MTDIDTMAAAAKAHGYQRRNDMTEAAVKKIITDKLAEAVAILRKEKCPHCGMVIGAAKVAKGAGANDFFSIVYGYPPSPSGGLFDSGPSSASLTKAHQSQSPSGGLFSEEGK